MGDYENVRQDVERFWEIGDARHRSDLSLAHLITGMVALQEGEYLAAYDDYNIAFTLTPNWTRDWLSKRGLRVIDSRSTLAQEYIQLIQRDPNNPENYLQLAHILMEFGVWNEALEYYRQYLTMVENPDLKSFIDMIASHL